MPNVSIIRNPRTLLLQPDFLHPSSALVASRSLSM